MNTNSQLSILRKEVISVSCDVSVDAVDILEKIAANFPEIIKEIPLIGKATKTAINIMNAKHLYDNLKAGILLDKISVLCNAENNFRDAYLTNIAPLTGSKDAVLRALDAVQEIDDDIILSSLALLASKYKINETPCDIFYYSMLTILKSIHVDEYYWFSQILDDPDVIQSDIKGFALYDSNTPNSLTIKQWCDKHISQGKISQYIPIIKTRKIEDIRSNLILVLQQPGIQSQSSFIDDDISYVLINSTTIPKIKPYFS